MNRIQIKPKLVGRTKWRYEYACGRCGNAVLNSDGSCGYCGSMIDWDDVPKDIKSEEQAKARGCETYGQTDT